MQADMLTIGIDAEIHDKLPADVFELVAVDQEKDWMQTAPRGIHWDRLLFSAKESVFKAWFPLTMQWLGFKDALVTFEPLAGTFRAQLMSAPTDSCSRCPSFFAGCFKVHDGLVLTAIAHPRLQVCPSHPGA
jgi:4'-phosphopantetheinyl transferase EntD